ncbi:MAG: BMP family ABC transporter substrate-binding protein [Fibrobacter sp.]|nr:BMP family ABC transporter substrate-binding protein [Fibrobacter sp.]
MNKKSIVVIFLLLVILAAIVVSIHSLGGSAPKQEKAVVGVIMPGSVSEEGWNSVHYKGIKEACDSLNAEVALIENVSESANIDSVIEVLANQGARIIILGSYYYPAAGAKSIRNRPDIFFYCCSAEFDSKNFKAYFGRMYQGRYLAGIVAGLTSKSGRIGYVAAMNNSEVNRGINAFALGVRRVNPKAKVLVSWTNSWNDADVEKAHANKLIDSGKVDLITYHQNRKNVPMVAEEKGIPYIGYNDVTLQGSELHLTTVLSNWYIIYREFIQDFLQQKNKDNMTYWTGVEKDAVYLSHFSPLVSESTAQKVQEVLNELKAGADAFIGPIRDNQGRRRCDKNETISDQELRSNMDWFVEGVELYE